MNLTWLKLRPRDGPKWVFWAARRNETLQCMRYPRGFRRGEPGAFIRNRKDITDADRAELLSLVSGLL